MHIDTPHPGLRTSRIELRGLSKRFGEILAVQDISFTTQPGTITGFLGPNGAGKTTTLRMLLGLVTPTSGTATIDGHAYRDLPSPRDTVGAVLESSNPYPGQTARQHLRIEALATDTPSSQINEVLRLVDLTHASNRRVGTFSLGMKQRLALATALLCDPPILILDEPANGLDPEGVRWLRRLVRELADEGRTILISSHILAEVAQTVDRVLIMNHGGADRRRHRLRAALHASGREPRGRVPRPHGRTRRSDPMNRLIRTELLKLHTIRATYGLGLLVIAHTALFASLEATRAGRKVAPISTAEGLSTVSTATGVTMILAAILGVILASGEYRHTSASLTYLATPRRGRVLTAKATAAAIVGYAYGILAGLVATATALIFIAAHHDHVTLSTATLAWHIAGAGLGAALLAAIGVAIGSLIRAQVPDIIGTLIWCLVIESILGGSITTIRPYLPYTIATTLGGAKLGAGAFGPGYTVSTQHALPFAIAAIALAALGALLALLATRTTIQHDIT